MSELIDKEALLDECLNHYEVGNIEQNCTMDWICKTVRNFPASPRWHRVEDGLPDVDEKVLVFAIGKLDGFIGDTVIALTSMSDTNWLNHHEKVDKPYWLAPWQYFLTDYRITHWMPLPSAQEPPKEEK